MSEKVDDFKKTKELKRKDNKHSQDDVMRVLSIYKLTQSPTIASERTGVPYSTVQRWISGDIPFTASDTRIIEEYEKRELLTISLLKDEALQQIFTKLPAASAAQAATIYGILTDKQIAMKSINEHKSDNTFIFADSSMSIDDKLSIIERVAQRSRTKSDTSLSSVSSDVSIDVDFDVVSDSDSDSNSVVDEDSEDSD